MISVRKRKTMLKKLNTFFNNEGGVLLSEHEYSLNPRTPYRLMLIKKYMGGYIKMIYFLEHYYPHWANSPIKEESAIDLSALDSEDDV